MPGFINPFTRIYNYHYYGKIERPKPTGKRKASFSDMNTPHNLNFEFFVHQEIYKLEKIVLRRLFLDKT